MTRSNVAGLVFDEVLTTEYAQIYIADPTLVSLIPPDSLPAPGKRCSAPRDDFVYLRTEDPVGPSRVLIYVDETVPEFAVPECDVRITGQHIAVFTWAWEHTYPITEFPQGRYRIYSDADLACSPHLYRIYFEPA